MHEVLLLNTTEPDRSNGSMVRYAAMVREALSRYAPQWKVGVLDLAPTQAGLNRFPRRLRTPVRYLAIAANARRRLPLQRDVILHLLDGSHAYLLGAVPRRSVPLVITVHDLIPALCLNGALGPDRPGRMGGWITRLALKHLKQADAILADSTSTMNDVVRLAGIGSGKIRVVHPPVSTPVVDVDFVVPDHYILHVAGNNTFYKNRHGVVDVFSCVRNAVPLKLVLAGAPPDAGLRQKVEKSGWSSEIAFVSNITENALAALYRKAALLLFPSVYEGFGWPPLEAMAQGCPVVCSKAGSLPEITGDAALTAAPGDLAALASHCLRVLREADLRGKMVAAGLANVRRFSPENLAEGLVKAYGVREAS